MLRPFCLLLAASGVAEALTQLDQLRGLLALRQQVVERGPGWYDATYTWTCGDETPGGELLYGPDDASAAAAAGCDPCGEPGSAWGNWEAIGCRKGDAGVVTNVHVTDKRIEGEIPGELCAFYDLRELDLDGGQLTGTLPSWLVDCFPRLVELDLGYNMLFGTLPEWLGDLAGGALSELQLQINYFTGTLPPSLGNQREMRKFWVNDNDLVGEIPADVLATWGATVQSFDVRNNPGLCGPAPDWNLTYVCCWCDFEECGVRTEGTALGAACDGSAGIARGDRCARRWEQCGGASWTGATACCDAAATCSFVDDEFWRCEPGTDGAGAGPSCALPYAQCDGYGFDTPLPCCDASATCEQVNEYWWHCVDGTGDERAGLQCAPTWAQCAGDGLNATVPCCDPEAACEPVDEWYSHCPERRRCAAEWAQCGGVGYAGPTACCDAGASCVAVDAGFHRCERPARLPPAATPR